MKTTLEVPDSLFRRAKVTAARKGQTLTAFITAAIEAKLASDNEAAQEKPWMEFAGIFETNQAESRRILRRIDEACEEIRSDDWE